MATSLDNVKGNIVIVGATGNSGLQLVEQALKRNYRVIAPVRNPEKLAHIKHKNLEVNYFYLFEKNQNFFSSGNKMRSNEST
jgi:putative NADH-flavin reductase